ncbi:CobW family GTP-binding protein [uncultured Tateyamaria sp.]|uniref:CobW family GTP-binding protein n=1 Tax=uncultured Tateyamaria sp. TaxID=455651 RepID=UPI002605E1F1|nr:CobW family GTP-binding protein [uncultured Tateyamaria sp.]
MSDGPLLLTIIAGYLGAGKTTLVNQLLRHANGTRYAVMVNEFGSLPIDEDLIEAEGDDLITLAGGCVCCSYGDDLMMAMAQMRDLEPRPDHILLEASGVALPGNIAAAISLFGNDIEVLGIVLLADAEALSDQLANPYLSDTVTRQLAAADLAVLTKVDLATPDQMQRARQIVAEHAPGVAVIESEGADLTQSILLLSRQDTQQAPGTDHTPHHIHLVTETLPMADAVDAENFANQLALDPKVVRAKGHLANSGDGRLMTLQLVGRRYSIYPAAAHVKPGLVIIKTNGQ